MRLGFSLSLTRLARIRGLGFITNFLPLGSDGLITSNGKIFLAKE